MVTSFAACHSVDWCSAISEEHCLCVAWKLQTVDCDIVFAACAFTLLPQYGVYKDSSVDLLPTCLSCNTTVPDMHINAVSISNCALKQQITVGLAVEEEQTLNVSLCGAVQLSAAFLVLSVIHYGARHGPSWLDYFKWLAIASVAIGGPRIAFKAIIGLRHMVGSHISTMFMSGVLLSPMNAVCLLSVWVSYGQPMCSRQNEHSSMLLACDGRSSFLRVERD